MADETTTGRAPNYLRLDTFQNVTNIHWPKKQPEPSSEESETLYDGYFLYPPVQQITTYFWSVRGQWEVVGSRTFGFPSLGYAIAGRQASGPFTAGEAASAMAIWNGWVAAYNSLGAYPGIEWSDPPDGVSAPGIIGLGISSSGGDSSHGYGVGALWITLYTLTIGGPLPTVLKPYGS
jgi:hypothetical protein